MMSVIIKMTAFFALWLYFLTGWAWAQVGIGTLNPAYDLDVNGVTHSADGFLAPADKGYTYAQPKTYYRWIQPTDFSGVGSLEQQTVDGSEVSPNSLLGPHVLVAPVNLPQHALITAVEVYFLDNGVGSLNGFSLNRSRPEVGTSGIQEVLFSNTTASSNNSRIQVMADNTENITDGRRIDNRYYFYTLIATFSTSLSTLTIKGVRITYTVVQAE
ncbi:MAG: hypothetical protein KF690_10735 [Bacteroidetes bacterium]|nr:hypothetical protein [Bacteroidota bacterium]